MASLFSLLNYTAILAIPVLCQASYERELYSSEINSSKCGGTISPQGARDDTFTVTIYNIFSVNLLHFEKNCTMTKILCSRAEMIKIQNMLHLMTNKLDLDNM